jgi:hypothetical protein
MGKMLAVLFIFGVFIGYANAQEAVQEPIWLQQHALFEKGITIVPLREIAEWAGAQVEWQGQTIVITKAEKRVVLTIGSRTATVDGQVVTLAVPPKVLKKVTYVPLRFVGEAFGVTVEFEEYSGQVVLYAEGKTARVVVCIAKLPRWWPKRVHPTLENYRHITVVGCSVMQTGGCAYTGQCKGELPDVPDKVIKGKCFHTTR